jgi:hypothetical protein
VKVGIRTARGSERNIVYGGIDKATLATARGTDPGAQVDKATLATARGTDPGAQVDKATLATARGTDPGAQVEKVVIECGFEASLS